jgi:hypothetical protein
MQNEILQLVNRINGNCDAFINYILLMRDINQDVEDYSTDADEQVKLISLIKATANDVADEMMKSSS